LRKVASQQGKSTSEVTRQVINLGISALENDDEFKRHSWRSIKPLFCA
jgi:hypothetical protein